VPFEYSPVIVKRYFTKPSLLHAGNHAKLRVASNPVVTLMKHRVNGLDGFHYTPSGFGGLPAPGLLNYRLLHRT
jgi:hypothetical protein